MQLSFGWISRIIYEGFSSKHLSKCQEHIRIYLPDTSKRDAPLSYRHIFREYRIMILTSSVLKLFSELIVVYNVDLIKKCALLVKDYASMKTGSDHELFLYLLFLLSLQVVNTFCMNHQEFLMSSVGLSLSRSLMDKIATDAISIKPKSDLDEGVLINLMSVDTQRIEAVFGHLHYVWSAPVQCCLIFYSLYQLIGVYSLIGVGIMILYIPVQLLVTSKLKEHRKVYRSLSGIYILTYLSPC